MSDGTVKSGTGTGNPILMLSASTSGTSVIQMGDTADNNIGQIHYVNSDDSMKFFANNAERVRIGSAGSFAIGTDAINANFAVGGAPGGGTGHLNVYTSNSGGWVAQMRNDHSNGNGLFLRGGGDAAGEYPLYVTNNDETNPILVASMLTKELVSELIFLVMNSMSRCWNSCLL